MPRTCLNSTDLPNDPINRCYYPHFPDEKLRHVRLSTLLEVPWLVSIRAGIPNRGAGPTAAASSLPRTPSPQGGPQPVVWPPVLFLAGAWLHWEVVRATIQAPSYSGNSLSFITHLN